jgi:hypothetical protein
MLMAAPSDAASPTKKALRGLPVRPAAAKIRQCRDRPIHQSEETRLDLLEYQGIATEIRQRRIFQSHLAPYHYGWLWGGGVDEGGGLIERIQAMIFHRSSEVWIRLPMAGIGPFTVPSPKR